MSERAGQGRQFKILEKRTVISSVKVKVKR